MSRLAILAIVAAIVLLAAVFFLPQGRLIIGKEKVPDAEFTVTVYHTHYEPSSIAVAQGDIVKINILTSPGTASYHHGLSIDGYGINAQASSETTPTVIDFVADKKGTFSGYCASCADGPFGTESPDKRLTLVVN